MNVSKSQKYKIMIRTNIRIYTTKTNCTSFQMSGQIYLKGVCSIRYRLKSVEDKNPRKSWRSRPGRRGQGSRCWRCWSRPPGSRCPRSCPCASPGQKEIVAKNDLSTWIFCLNISPRYVFCLNISPEYFAGSRSSTHC